jgi:Mn2+/Fe2+ NRAMP family transporter
MKTADNKKIMKKNVNGLISKTLGWVYFVIITLVAIAAIPLMILSNMGQG